MAMEYAVLALAITVYQEAGGDGHRGMQAVADTAIVRLHDSKFPNTVEGVLLQSGQFQWHRLGRHKTVGDLQRIKKHLISQKEPRTANPVIWNEALSIAQAATAPGYKPTYHFRHFNTAGKHCRGTRINHLCFR